MAIQANHGGGYQYRLCLANSPLTEECFQQNPLEFVDDQQWIQFNGGYDVNSRTMIPAVRISEGTVPAGSTWTKNLVPACADSYLGGACDDRRKRDQIKCSSTQFPPPSTRVHGFGGATCTLETRDLAAHPTCTCTADEFKERTFDFSILDQIRVPLVPGEYVLGCRWDCEQTPQLWSNCADIRIVKEGAEEPTKPFIVYKGCEACCETTRGQCANCTKCINDRTGDCAYCYKPSPGFHPAHVPDAVCLGYEDNTTGGPPV